RDDSRFEARSRRRALRALVLERLRWAKSRWMDTRWVMAVGGRHAASKKNEKPSVQPRVSTKPTGGFEPSNECLRTTCSTTELRRREHQHTDSSMSRENPASVLDAIHR